jgi:hypothetical protein
LKKKTQNKKESQSKKTLDEEAKIKRKELYELRLTSLELIHLRDMLSILYPSETKKTISQSLASSEEREFEESSLWKKVSRACVEAKLPIGEEAPDYAIVPIAHPPMGIFMLGQNESEVSVGESYGFLKNESDEEE